MKKVISVSLGSSKRDHRVETEILGEPFVIERRGTNGDMMAAIELIRKLDGKVDAFGLGGTDLYVFIGNKRYTIREAAKIANAARVTPIVDGSGLKNTLERRVINHLHYHEDIRFDNKKILMVCALDRFGMAEAIEHLGGSTVYGDLIFALGLPIPLHSLKALYRVARIVVPVASQMPFKYLYPTGSKQEETTVSNKYRRYYQQADIIAGDFHYIKKHLPGNIQDKVIITNTVTSEDVLDLKKRGAKILVTTTPELNGRSFGTNVMEAAMVSLLGKPQSEITADDYQRLLTEIDFAPRIEYLA